MKTSALLPLALWAASGALAWPSPWDTECKWRGTAPFCGSSGHSVNDVDEGAGEILAATTEGMNRFEACYKLSGRPPESEIQQACLDDYGRGCFSGYKRLWCKI